MQDQIARLYELQLSAPTKKIERSSQVSGVSFGFSQVCWCLPLHPESHAKRAMCSSEFPVTYVLSAAVHLFRRLCLRWAQKGLCLKQLRIAPGEAADVCRFSGSYRSGQGT